jgi:hypothetical protein
MGENSQILKKIFLLFVFKGYTCRFKSEAFASFASIALRPWCNVSLLASSDKDPRGIVFFIYVLLCK